MKYRYRNTDTIVESSIGLDSAVFQEIKDDPVPEQEKKATARKTRKKTAREDP